MRCVYKSLKTYNALYARDADMMIYNREDVLLLWLCHFLFCVPKGSHLSEQVEWKCRIFFYQRVNHTLPLWVYVTLFFSIWLCVCNVDCMFHNSWQKSGSYSFTHLMYLFLHVTCLFLFPFLSHFMSERLCHYQSIVCFLFPFVCIIYIANCAQHKMKWKSGGATAYGCELSMDCLIHVTLNWAIVT